MTITLNDAEQKLARYLAASRHASNRSEGTKNSRIGPQSDEQTDLEGIGAEIAFCKIHNIYPDTQIAERPAADAYLPDGTTVDVKATPYPNGHLLAVRWKKCDVQMYSLMVGTFPTYRHAGMMPAPELLRPERLKNFGYGDSYAAKQSELAA
jgi:hypothetical protein